MGFADLAARMDALVDDRLGDDILYSQAGAPFVAMKAFVGNAEGDQDLYGVKEIDSLPKRKRLKISRALIGRPSGQDRIKGDMLGETVYRPSQQRPETAGRYWIIDLERC